MQRIEHSVPQLLVAGAACLPAGVSFRGSATYPSAVVVEGRFEGDLHVSDGQLVVVATDGAVNGAISGGSLRVLGEVHGSIACPAGSVEFFPSARCVADVVYRELDIARGAQVDADLSRAGDTYVR